jgi:hypothetical protein
MRQLSRGTWVTGGLLACGLAIVPVALIGHEHNAVVPWQSQRPDPRDVRYVLLAWTSDSDAGARPTEATVKLSKQRTVITMYSRSNRNSSGSAGASTFGCVTVRVGTAPGTIVDGATEGKSAKRVRELHPPDQAKELAGFLARAKGCPRLKLASR